MDKHSELNRLQHLVDELLRIRFDHPRRPHLERAIRAEMRALVDYKALKIEALSEKDMTAAELRILDALNPNHKVIFSTEQVVSAEINKLRYKALSRPLLRAAQKLSALLPARGENQLDPEDVELMRRLPLTTRELANQLYFMLIQLVPVEERPRLAEEDISALGARISRLILDNADNFTGVPRLGPGLGGPLGRGPAGKIIEVIPDIIGQLQHNDNLQHTQDMQLNPALSSPFHPVPRPEPVAVDDSVK